MKITKKLIATLLAVLLLFGTVGAALSASAATSNLPLIYVQGQGVQIIDNDGTVLYEDVRVPLPEGAMDGLVNECLPLFAKALVTDDWDEYREKILSYWVPIYEKLALDKNGELTNGTRRNWSWNASNVRPSYYINSYPYIQDWRLDPFENAADLNAYIKAVKAKTGAPKVNLLGRCEGANVVLAYLAEYGYDDVNCVSFYVSSALGVDTIGALFSGDVRLDPKALKYFYDNKIDLGESELTELINSALEYLVESFGFEELCRLLEKAIPKVWAEIGYELVITSYGSFPGMWSCVGPQYYEKARDNVFAGREDEYANFIAKIDKYDTEVRSRIGEIIAEGQAQGVKFANFEKYGEFWPNAPFCQELYELSDDAVSVKYSTFGATATKRNEKFGADYLINADSKYISPCKRIDMSTSLLKDTTWMEYNSNHNDFHTATDLLIKTWYASDGEMTVHSDPDYPQFIIKDGNALRPLTTADLQQETESLSDNVFVRIIRMFLRFFMFLTQALEFIMNK